MADHLYNGIICIKSVASHLRGSRGGAAGKNKFHSSLSARALRLCEISLLELDFISSPPRRREKFRMTIGFGRREAWHKLPALIGMRIRNARLNHAQALAHSSIGYFCAAPCNTGKAVCARRAGHAGPPYAALPTQRLRLKVHLQRCARWCGTAIGTYPEPSHERTFHLGGGEARSSWVSSAGAYSQSGEVGALKDTTTSR